LISRCRPILLKPPSVTVDTILCDSICLSESAGKTRPLDVEMITRLEAEHGLNASDRMEIFNAIFEAKRDISGE